MDSDSIINDINNFTEFFDRKLDSRNVESIMCATAAGVRGLLPIILTLLKRIEELEKKVGEGG